MSRICALIRCVDKYIMACSSTSEQKLSSKYKKLAKTNLGEDFKNDQAHCEAMRRWLSSMPHLTCPTGKFGRAGNGNNELMKSQILYFTYLI